MLLSFMIGAPKAFFPFMLGASVPVLCLPLLGAPKTLFYFLESVLVMFRGEKNEDLRPLSKVDEVVVYPYHLGEVAFQFLTYREDPFDSSS